MLYTALIRPLLFALTRKDPEVAHEWALNALEWLDRHPLLLDLIREWYGVSSPKLPQTIAGITFPNPVGLAAGFSKDGQGLRGLTALGFGFIEAGTVTPKAQQGNRRPRMFRLKEDRCLINRMGFNNQGAQALGRRLKMLGHIGIPVGCSIGKGKDTPNDQAVEDYAECFAAVAPHCSYVAINVSSPNTKDLRKLQDADLLRQILSRLIAMKSIFAGKNIPLFVKIAPDMAFEHVTEIVSICQDLGVDGIIACNTTISRYDLRGKVPNETGGLSGSVLYRMALPFVRHIRILSSQLTIIGVGGISEDWQVKEMLDNGANLVQLYTCLVYNGPATVKRILRGLLKSLDEEGLESIQEIALSKALAKSALKHI